MQEHRTEERKKRRSIKHQVAMLMPFPSEEPLWPRTKPSSTLKKLFEETLPRQERSSQKGVVQEKFWIRNKRSSNGTRKQARGPSGALDSERNYNIPRPQNLPSFQRGSLASQANMIHMSLPIYREIDTVALGKTDSISRAQTPMHHHPVEAYFHTPLE